MFEFKWGFLIEALKAGPSEMAFFSYFENML